MSLKVIFGNIVRGKKTENLLYNVHVQFKIISVFQNMTFIPHFHRYFSETWALAMYHDRFADFREEVRELLITRPVRFCLIVFLLICL